MEKNNKENEELNKISILETIEKERQRIANGLHDDVVQNLIYLSQQTEIIQKYLSKDLNSANLELEEMRYNLKNIISQLRDTIYDLRPMVFDDLGWENAFLKLKEDLEYHMNWKINFDIDKLSGLSQISLLTIYRIVKEACNNAKKHSKATILNVSIIDKINYIYLLICDNGIGFSIDSLDKMNHFGFKEIKENVILLNGKVALDSSKESGTKIEIIIPKY